MRNIKYVLFTITAFIFGITLVNAKEITITGGCLDNPTIYDGTTINNTENVMYDESTNTLTFNNYMCANGNDPSGTIVDMEDLNVVINGKNYAKDQDDDDLISFSVQNTTLHFSGNGTFVAQFGARNNDIYFDNFEGAVIALANENIYVNNSKFYNNFPDDMDNVNYEEHYKTGLSADYITFKNSTLEVMTNNSDFDCGLSVDVLTMDNSNVKIQTAAGLNGARINIINNSTVDIYSILAIGEIAKLNIESSTLNIKYGLYGVMAQEINIDNSKVNIEYTESELMSKWKEEMLVNTPEDFGLAIYSQKVEITGDVEILQGGNLYSDCLGEGTEQVCYYYIAEEEVDGIAEVFKRMRENGPTQGDYETLKKLSANIRIGILEPEPAEENIIHNVPNTGIVTIVGIVLGVGILSYGAYLLIKSSKKEAIK